MAAQVGSLFVSLTANVLPFAQGMTRAQAVTSTAMNRIRRDAGVAERSVQGFWNTTGRSSFRPYSLIAVSRAFDNASDRAGLLRGSILATTAVFGGFTAALSSNLVLRYADSYTKLINQLRVVSDGAVDTAARFEAIEAVARRSRSSLEATAILYSRIQKAAPERGAEEVLRFTETIQKALTLGGATIQEARSAAIQFSQAIASNRLGGEELRAILETPLGLELARGLDVTLGKFREMGHAGELTSDVVLGALAKIEGRINNQFSQSIQTLDQAIVHVDNSLTSYIGRLNETYGGTQLLTKAIVGFGDNLETLVPTLATILGLLTSIFLARNKALLGGLAGGAAGAFLGNQVGGLEGAVVGGALGGLLGFRGPDLVSSIRDSSKVAVENVVTLSDRVAKLKVQYRDAGHEILTANKALRTFGGDERLQFARRSLQSAYERAVFAGGGAPTAEQSQRISAARLAADQDAQNRLRGTIQESTAVFRTYGQELRKAEADLAAMTKSTTLAGQAKSFLARQATSVIGLFGGPWGVAITAAITGLGYLALRSQQTAQEVANAEKIIADALNAAGEAGDRVAEKTFLQIKQEELQSSIKLLEDYAKATRDAIDSPTGFADPRERLFGSRFTQGRDEVLRLVEELRNGSISLEDFNSRIGALQASDEIFADIGDRALEGAKKIDRQSQAVAKLEQDIRDLDQAQKSLGQSRFAPGGAFAAFQEARAKATGEIITGLNQELHASRLKSRGLFEEARALEIYYKAVEDGKDVSYDVILAKVREIETVERATDAVKDQAEAWQSLRFAAEQASNSALADFPTANRGEISSARLDLRQEIEIARLNAAGADAEAQAQEKINEMRAEGILLSKEQEADVRNLVRALVQLQEQTDKDYTVTLRLEAEKEGLESLFEFNLEKSGAVGGTLRTLQLGNEVLRLRAAGRDVDAETAEVINDLTQQYGPLTVAQEAAIRTEIEQQVALEKTIDAMNKSGRSVETLAERLARLKAESLGAFLPEIDRSVLQQARELKVAASDIEAYVRAVQGGNLASAPPLLLELRDMELFQRAAQSVDGIVQQYGNLSQIAPLAAAKQQELAIAVENGAITAQQAKIAYADFLGEFEQFSIIGEVGDAFGEFARSALDDFSGIGDAAKDMGLKIIAAIQEMILIQPAVNALRAGLGSVFGGGGTVVSAVGATLFHRGGVVGAANDNAHRMLPAGVVAMAPRFHKGLSSREYAAVLERGEHVLTEEMAGRTAAVMGGLSRMAASGGGGGGPIEVFIDVGGARGNAEIMEMVSAGVREGMREVDRALPERIREVQKSPRRRGGR